MSQTIFVRVGVQLKIDTEPTTLKKLKSEVRKKIKACIKQDANFHLDRETYIPEDCVSDENGNTHEKFYNEIEIYS